jgi:hypothetical protein
LEGCELKAESGILHRNGSMTAHHESNESKDGQKDDWHVSRSSVFHPVPSQPVTGRRNNDEAQYHLRGCQRYIGFVYALPTENKQKLRLLT